MDLYGHGPNWLLHEEYKRFNLQIFSLFLLKKINLTFKKNLKIKLRLKLVLVRSLIISDHGFYRKNHKRPLLLIYYIYIRNRKFMKF